MFDHILVPLDGSAMAEAALSSAVVLSERLKSRVTLMHVIERGAPGEIHGDRHLRAVEEATVYLKRVAEEVFPKGAAVDLHVHSAEVTNVAGSIVEHATELGYDLVCMCTHGKGKARHMILGSIAERVISGGRFPVLVTRPAAKGPLALFSCATMFAPLDGDPEHEHALQAAIRLGRACNSTVHLAFVVPSLSDLSGERAAASRLLPGATSRILEMSVEEAETYLEDRAGTIRKEGIEVETHVLRGEPASALVGAARQLGAGLIVMGTHGKSGMDAFWAGSVAHRVTSQTDTPLLLIPLKE